MVFSLESVDAAVSRTAERLRSKKLARFEEWDVRIEAGDHYAAAAQQGEAKAGEYTPFVGVGIRYIAAHRGVFATANLGALIPTERPDTIPDTLHRFFGIAQKRARSQARQKNIFFSRHNLTAPAEYVAVSPVEKSFEVRCKKDPNETDIEALSSRVVALSSGLKSMRGLATNYVSVSAGREKKWLIHSDGALLSQTWPITEMFVFCSAKGKAVESHYASNGHKKGLEVLEGDNTHKQSLEEFTAHICQGTVDLSNAPAAPDTAETTVVTDPWFNTLLSHEILGHPSEADRALKREANWAGRAWWYKSLSDHQLGKRVGSPLLNVSSDPGMEGGYGHYFFDDEGIRAKRVEHLRDGVLSGFLNSRETSAILGMRANGGMRADYPTSVPVIRMNNTFIEPGDRKPEEIISETRDGYYAVGEKIPSIGETRQNFRITCWKLYRIQNGEIGQLYRSGGVTADSPAFLQSIDALGTDFRLYNVPNCGKGTPMQTMRVGNGGPTLRAKARITSGS